MGFCDFDAFVQENDNCHSVRVYCVHRYSLSFLVSFKNFVNLSPTSNVNTGEEMQNTIKQTC
jgi:hypothetical protein